MGHRPTICFPYVGDSVGGSHLSSLLLIEAIDRNRFDVVVVVHEIGPLSDLLSARGISYDYLPIPAYAGSSPEICLNALRIIRATPVLLSFLRRRRVNLVHTNDLRMHLTWPIAARLAGCYVFWHQRVILSNSLLWRVIPVVAHHVFCISIAVRNSLPAMGKTPVEVLYNPIHLENQGQSRYRLRQALCKELHLPFNMQIIGYVGNMTKQKRPLVFIEAAARISVCGQGNYAFVMVGDNRGGELENVQQIAKGFGIGNRVKILGYRSPIEPIMAGLDVLLAPGYNDGFGRTLVEAMAVGTPVIAANTGGHLELIDDGVNGVLVEQDNPEAFAEAALEILSNDEKCDNLTKSAYESVQTLYSQERHVGIVQSVYIKIINK